MDYSNEIILNSIIALLAAQLLKFVTVSYKEKKPIYRALISTGGMPSSHSALVTAMTASIYLYRGVDLYFAISLMVSLVVIHDSMGIRLEASKHAMILNKVTQKLEMDVDDINKGNPLKEPLGHFPIEVFFGVLLGISCALLGFPLTK
ncbi:acid phosphatase family membrane protein YuiD [Acholeplasma morum]|jgi:acid phosphatase family membrane protein YuiD|uniref:divergent PAP2 family protein n=1 Tax=Paracholeplasma morum TaxID=264637 RepID=UPI0019574872|nr:divergent PAP2 family protein [Paracholeplasma morum]MBM7453147.1 acid phosphatase family membrane protein YuiD [Paracholeplasma morum]